MKRSYGLAGVLLFASLVVSAHAQDNVKMIADFDAQTLNNLGGNYGAFSPDASEKTYVCVASSDSAVKHGETGSSLRLDYNVTKGGSYNGFWMKLGSADSGNNFDASGFKKLTFWVKGDEKSGIPNKFKVELKGDSGPVGKKYIEGLTGKWVKIEIPLDVFSNAGVDLKKLNELTVVFEQSAVSPTTTGAINIDDIALEK